jgi:predicted TIM-barrel fold metal-dependent hydrolase
MSRAVWDCHAHVIGDPARFPFVPGRAYTPAPASLDAYLSMLDRHGVARGVLVQPSVYGFDNTCLLEALDEAGGRLCGIAVPPPDARARDLESMHRRGVRGVRVNAVNPGGLPIDVVIGWQPVLRALGWHVELQVAIDDVPDLAALVRRFDVPVAIDHMGRPRAGRLDPAAGRLRELVDLVREGACFVKLSAPYRLSAEAPPWRDVAPLARALVAADPRACLWGTDWPHVHMTSPVRTDDVFEALDDWCPDAGDASIVTANAARALYG